MTSATASAGIDPAERERLRDGVRRWMAAWDSLRARSG